MFILYSIPPSHLDFVCPGHPGIIELNVEPYDEDQGTGDLRYVQVSNA